MNLSHETPVGHRAGLPPLRIQPGRDGKIERRPPKGPEPLPHRYTAATVRELPRWRDIHVFDATW